MSEMSEVREYLNTSDEYVSDFLRLAAKALAEAYQSNYDMPKDLPDGWIAIRVGIHPECHKVRNETRKTRCDGF